MTLFYEKTGELPLNPTDPAFNGDKNEAFKAE
jgi:hypothetical protein